MATEPSLTQTDSEALITSSNYVRPPLVTANIISQSTSDPGRVRKRGRIPFIFFHTSIPAVHASFGRKAIAGEHGKNTIPPNDAPNPQRCLPAGPSQQARLTDPVPDPPHPDVRDEGGLESASCSHTRSIQGPALVPRPDYLHVRFFSTRPCGAGRPKHHTSRELRPRCPLVQRSHKKKNPPGHFYPLTALLLLIPMLKIIILTA